MAGAEFIHRFSQNEIVPLDDWVVIEPIPRGKTLGGVALPDDASTGPPEGKVLATGPGRVTDDGKVVPNRVVVGDVVLLCFPSYGPPIEGVEHKGKKCIMGRMRDIVACVRPACKQAA